MSRTHSVNFEYTSVTVSSDGKVSRSFPVTVNTWNTWRLLPVSLPVIAQPNPSYTYIEIPGRSGSIDITNYLTGGIRPPYSDRTGTLEFYATNVYDDDGWTSSIATLRQQLADVFDGRVMKVSLEDDRHYYYEGRVFFRGITPDASHSKVTLEYRLKPMRYKSTGEEASL